MTKLSLSIFLPVCFIAAGCASSGNGGSDSAGGLAVLESSLRKIADNVPGEVGIALITDRGDTLLIDNEDKYPLMSVFKLHQAIALCKEYGMTRQSIDSVISVPRKNLNPDTWSPMLKDYPEDTIRISIRDMLVYTLTKSDNNASNYLFHNIQPVEEVDQYIATVVPRDGFSIAVTEEQMYTDHSLLYENHTSPLSATLLMDRLYADTVAAGAEYTDFIRETLRMCITGNDRIMAPLDSVPGITVGHKTGSGFRTPDGVLTAHNDVGYVMFPDGRHYTLAIFIKDFRGSESEASGIMAEISAAVYRGF
ncbi:MAG: serine hydrolase [Bacteroides sp.]|nr:serine hydrolase [Bacteroides sp.]